MLRIYYVEGQDSVVAEVLHFLGGGRKNVAKAQRVLLYELSDDGVVGEGIVPECALWVAFFTNGKTSVVDEVRRE